MSEERVCWCRQWWAESSAALSFPGCITGATLTKGRHVSLAAPESELHADLHEWASHVWSVAEDQNHEICPSQAHLCRNSCSLSERSTYLSHVKKMKVFSLPEKEVKCLHSRRTQITCETKVPWKVQDLWRLFCAGRESVFGDAFLPHRRPSLSGGF